MLSDILNTREKYQQNQTPQSLMGKALLNGLEDIPHRKLNINKAIKNKTESYKFEKEKRTMMVQV